MPATLASIDADDVPRQREGLCCRSLDDEAVVYDAAHHAVHYLNPTACFIWTHCDGRLRVGQIAATLADAYELDDEQAAEAVLRDVRETLTELAGNGLIDMTRS